jgi:3-deoxy-D-manno-octulosonate 8-phosphate phosphatase (KDO 8-P phosphatase)
VKNNKPGFVIFDIDGVMTTGQFLYSENGKEYKIFGPHDNDGIKLLSDKFKVVFLTADKRGLSISKKRIVDDMNQELFLVGERERLSFIESKFGLQNVIYMGDGLHDAIILKNCRFGIAPRNARIEAKRSADYVTPTNSGEGAVLDASLKILKKYFRSEYKQITKMKLPKKP